MPPTSDEQVQCPAQAKTHIAVHWFRNGLRVHDNPALNEAVDRGLKVYCLFIFDGEVAGTKNSGYNRMRFLHESLTDLDRTLQQFGGHLLVMRGDPVHVFSTLIEEWSVSLLTFEEETEPMYQARDQAVRNLCRNKGVEVVEKLSHTLYHPTEIIKANGGHPPHTFQLLNQVISLIGDPPRPVHDPHLNPADFSLPDNFEQKFSLPSLEELGCTAEYEEQKNPINVWIGGETHGLELLQTRLDFEAKAFQDGHTLPNQFNPDLLGTPKTMSPHVRFGCISVRRFYWSIHDLYAKFHVAEPPSCLTSQLLWREFFNVMSFNNPNYGVMEGNPICLQIPWYRNEEQLKRWEMGETGYPWIDACMNQLRYEGWIHHVGRHAVACFLTRGDLWLHWEDGVKIFDKYQIDNDWSVSAGNWMWVSSSAFENCLQCPQCFSPVMYGMRMDPTGEYIRRYVPVLKNMPLKYLFMPWKAPLSVQEAAGCVVGRDYPTPMVDHSVASRDCQEMMEQIKSLCKDPDAMYCGPSSSEEVTEFCWLRKQSAQHKCSYNEKCDMISQ